MEACTRNSHIERSNNELIQTSEAFLPEFTRGRPGQWKSNFFLSKHHKRFVQRLETLRQQKSLRETNRSAEHILRSTESRVDPRGPGTTRHTKEKRKPEDGKFDRLHISSN
jgi:hypothetical protein